MAFLNVAMQLKILKKEDHQVKLQLERAFQVDPNNPFVLMELALLQTYPLNSFISTSKT